ncbi:MAG: hypothetical protein OEZ04_09290, partial [Nitrospinota bacterium]|nr:hypothetical protein [Nitrospinota bacterium]
MSKIIDKAEEYALEKGLWPLSIPFFLLPIWYWLFKEYHEIAKFKDVLLDLDFLLVAILIVIASGLAQFTVYVLKPTLHEHRLVVLIAHFNELGDEVRERGAAFAKRIERELKSKIKDGAPMEVCSLHGKIEPEPGETMEDAARRLGKAPQTLAHLVLFGDIELEDGELCIEPKIAIIEKFANKEIQEREIVSGTTSAGPQEPTYLELKKIKARETADMVALVTGLSFLRAGKYADTLKYLKTVHNTEAAFYRGLVLSKMAASSFDPVPLYLKAADEYNKALEVWKRDTSPQQWATTQNNLGNA